MELQEVSNMETMESVLVDGSKEETVVIDEEPDPNDVGDWQYRYLLETQYMRELKEQKESKR